jgi:hypothetical protein
VSSKQLYFLQSPRCTIVEKFDCGLGEILRLKFASWDKHHRGTIKSWIMENDGPQLRDYVKSDYVQQQVEKQSLELRAHLVIIVGSRHILLWDMEKEGDLAAQPRLVEVPSRSNRQIAKGITLSLSWKEMFHLQHRTAGRRRYRGGCYASLSKPDVPRNEDTLDCGIRRVQRVYQSRFWRRVWAGKSLNEILRALEAQLSCSSLFEIPFWLQLTAALDNFWYPTAEEPVKSNLRHSGKRLAVIRIM